MTQYNVSVRHITCLLVRCYTREITYVSRYDCDSVNLKIISTATLKNILQEKICIQMFKVLSKRLFKTGLLLQNEMKNHKYVTDLVFELKIELCYN